MVPLFNCNVAAPVSVTAPPLIVELVSFSVCPLAEIVPPVLASVVLFTDNIPPVASIVPVLLLPLPVASIVSPADWLALIVPEFTSVKIPKLPPMLPAPWIVSWFVRVSLVTAPKMTLPALFDSVTVPPLRVTFPCNTNCVEEPDEFNCTVPSCEYVPVSRFSTAALSILNVPPAELLIVPPSVLAKPDSTSIVPVALLVNVLPLWIVPLFICNVDAPVSVTAPPLIVELVSFSVCPLAEIVPPVLASVVLFTDNIPAVASIVPVLLLPLPVASIVSPADWLALIVPEFTSVKIPKLPPMLPAPWIVSWLVRVSLVKIGRAHV